MNQTAVVTWGRITLGRVSPSRIRAAMRRRVCRLLGRQTAPLPTYDAYVVGYPKVGNTWFQVMLRMALVRCYGLGDEWLSKVVYPQIDVDEPPPAPVPRIEITHDMVSFPEGDYRRVRSDPRRYRGRPVVLLVRDPKDTLVSLYMHYVYREQGFIGTPDEMVHDAEYGLDKYLQFYRSWFRQRRTPASLLIVRYEDMRLRTAECFQSAIETLGLAHVSGAIVEECVAYGSLDNMRRMEASNALGIPALAPPSLDSEDAFKVRRGRVGGYDKHLSAETAAYIDRRVRRELPAIYGYPYGEAEIGSRRRVPLSGALKDRYQ